MLLTAFKCILGHLAVVGVLIVLGLAFVRADAMWEDYRQYLRDQTRWEICQDPHAREQWRTADRESDRLLAEVWAEQWRPEWGPLQPLPASPDVCEDARPPRFEVRLEPSQLW